MHFYLHTFRKSPLRSPNTNFLALHTIDWLILRLFENITADEIRHKNDSKAAGVPVKWFAILQCTIWGNKEGNKKVPITSQSERLKVQNISPAIKCSVFYTCVCVCVWSYNYRKKSKNSALQGNYVWSSSNLLLTFRNNLSVPLRRVQSHFRTTYPFHP
jgi:hypothetical protein